MRYKIKDIPNEGLLCDQPLSPELLRDALDGAGADLGRSAGAIRVELTRTGRDVVASGAVKATVGMPCSLCLGPARTSVDAPIKLIFVPEEDEERADGSDEKDPLDDTDFVPYDGDVIDLAPIVREQLILAVPMSIHCKDDCRGLCPTCGQDLNERDCGHREGGRPAQLGDQLKKLKLDLKS